MHFSSLLAEVHCALCPAFRRRPAPFAAHQRHLSAVRHSPSSTAYLARQAKDPYVARAAAEGYRSRAAFKLSEMDDRHALLRPGMGPVVDLGAAPGSWTQVACRRTAPTRRSVAEADTVRGAATRQAAVSLASDGPSAVPTKRPSRRRSVLEVFDDGVRTRVDAAVSAPVSIVNASSRVIGLDLLAIAPLPGATLLQGDFTARPLRRRVAELLAPRGGAALVLSDMAHSFAGSASLDHIRQMALAWTAAAFGVHALQPGGALLVKVRYGEHLRPLVDALRRRFDAVAEVKPPSSRADSAEAYLVATGFAGRGGGRGAAEVLTDGERRTLEHLGVEWGGAEWDSS